MNLMSKRCGNCQFVRLGHWKVQGDDFTAKCSLDKVFKSRLDCCESWQKAIKRKLDEEYNEDNRRNIGNSEEVAAGYQQVID